jgi:DUF1365 family protein
MDGAKRVRPHPFAAGIQQDGADMSAFTSALYPGRVMHQRFKPRRHKFKYGIFLALFDLDELERLDQRLRWFSYNSWNVFSFFDRDHLSGRSSALRPDVERLLGLAGLGGDVGAIRLLCMPRVFGYVFNPISVYFCHRRDGSLMATLYEVNNTFGGRHLYLIAAPRSDGWIAQRCAKQLHVSPFNDMGLTYRFRVRPPDSELAFNVNAHDGGGLLLATGFIGRRTDFTDRRLRGLIFSYPLLTFKVILGIHYEALRLLLKGMRLRPAPPPPPEPATIIPLPQK